MVKILVATAHAIAPGAHEGGPHELLVHTFLMQYTVQTKNHF